MPDYQSLPEFLTNPFELDKFEKDSSYDIKYNEFMHSNKIKVHSSFKLDENYLIHVKVPSESSEGVLYDVVIEFFPESDMARKEMTLEHYSVKFFSNSPGFVYKYAYVYKQKGYFIDGFEDKLGEATTTAPAHTNIDENLGYDKSIYFASKYLMDKKFLHLSKGAQYLTRTRNWDKFVSDVKSSDDIKSSRTANKDKVLKGTQTNDKKKPPTSSKHNNQKNRVTKGVKVVSAKSYTGDDTTRTVRHAKVVRPSKSTKKH